MLSKTSLKPLSRVALCLLHSAVLENKLQQDLEKGRKLKTVRNVTPVSHRTGVSPLSQDHDKLTLKANCATGSLASVKALPKSKARKGKVHSATLRLEKL